MGSSAKKKKEKRQDFQKPKYKVGKAKPKPSNFTDTSFKSKGIVMSHQSLSSDAPETSQLFKHNLSLAASSRSDKQRQEAISYLTRQLSMDPPVNPVGTHVVLAKLLPLVSDSSNAVRSQLQKLFRALPSDSVRHSTEQVLLFIRAGMTHLSADVSNTALGFMEWLLDVAQDELVACPGGWVKTLSSFHAMMGWTSASSEAGWSRGSRATLKVKDSQTQARQIATLARFLQAGLRPEASAPQSSSEYWDNLYRIPRESNAFDHLNLTGPRRGEAEEMYPSREARQEVFHRMFLDSISSNVEHAKKGGGAVGRAAAALDKALLDGLEGYEVSTAWSTQDLLDLW